MFLPTPAPSSTPESKAADLRAVRTVKGAPDGTGHLMARFEPRSRAYLVRRLTIQGPDGSWCRVYVGERADRNMVDGTVNGTADVADYTQPLYVPAGEPLVFAWTNPNGTPAADDGATYARAEVEDI